MSSKTNGAKLMIAAYLGDRSTHMLREEDVMKLTHINYAFAHVKDGEVTGSHLKNIGRLNELKALNPDLKTVISIGGWGAGGFSEAASTPESRKKFADTAVELMLRNNFDGIDIDWEYPCSSLAGIASSPDDKQNFTLMLAEIREKLDLVGRESGKHYMLNIAAGAGQYFLDGTEMDKAQQYLDYVNLMTYDMRGSFQNTTGHHTNLYDQTGDPDGISGERAVNMFVEAGVPVEKIVLGAAFYARVWKGVENAGTGLNRKAQTTGCHTIDYTGLLESYINKNGYTRYWDDLAKAPYLFNGDTFISYDDEESLTYKAEFIKNIGLAGIMFWEYPLDSSYTLVDRLYKEINCK